jgi:hypothetical protein
VWEGLATRLERIRVLELLLVPAASAFAYALMRHGQRLDRIGSDIAKAWGPRLPSVEAGSIAELRTQIESAYGNEAQATRLVEAAALLSNGAYADAVRTLVALNADVMARRGGAAWIGLEGGRIAVRLKEETAELPSRAYLRAPWRNTYFIDSLHRVQKALEVQRGR